MQVGSRLEVKTVGGLSFDFKTEILSKLHLSTYIIILIVESGGVGRYIHFVLIVGILHIAHLFCEFEILYSDYLNENQCTRLLIVVKAFRCTSPQIISQQTARCWR